jgi:hypothetical protein
VTEVLVMKDPLAGLLFDEHPGIVGPSGGGFVPPFLLHE